MTDPPTTIIYSIIVSRDSIQIALMSTILNDLDFLACTIGNAYLNAENVHTIVGAEFMWN
jgi:hypothetical protein